MDIILLQDMDKLGDKYEIVNVKDGYGRNYLIPQGIGVIANARNLAKLDEIKRKEMEEVEKMLDHYREIAEQLEGKILKIGAKAGQSGKIFGSVTNVQIAAALREQLDVDIERRKIKLPEDIKELGNYTATLDLHPEVQPRIGFEVFAE
jgi:large subunit ribosomal protein L9